MKKNTMMRVASALLVAVLLTTCAISGTFAKYVTSDSATDSARVAKFGVTVEVNGDDAFATSYKTNNDTYNASMEYSVVADANVVAPGTAMENALTFTIAGTPEVAVEVAFEVTDIKDVKLPAGTYLDWRKADNDADDVNYDKDNDDSEKFTLDKDYHPIVWTLTVSDEGENNVIKKGTLAEIQTAINAYIVAKPNYEANTKLDETYTLSWAWAFEQNQDEADTYLGNVAAGKITDSNCSTTVSFDFSITVTQVD